MDPVLIDAWPDAAKALSIGKSTLWELIARGELESVKIGARRLVPTDAINDYVRRLREQARTAADENGDGRPPGGAGRRTA